MGTELVRDPGYPIYYGRYTPHTARPRVGPEGRERRRLALEPVFAWVRSHANPRQGISQTGVVRLAYRRRTGYGCTSNHAFQVRQGYSPAPDWLIEEMCAIIGESRETIFAAHVAMTREAPAATESAAGSPVDARALDGWDMA